MFAEKTFHTYYEPMRAVRTARHKLIVNFEISTRVDVPTDVRESPIYPLMLAQLDQVRPPVELYDLRDDPWEQHNLALDPDVQVVASDLRQRLLRVDAGDRRSAAAGSRGVAVLRVGARPTSSN